MNDFIELMSRPLVACFILAGIHAYLGLHVVKRGIIFVDLALAQIAALGTTVGFLAGFGLHSTGSYVTSLLFAVGAAGLFAFLRFEEKEVPLEAYIGIAYAIASAAAILVLSIAPEGGEELKALMVGHLLFVDWNQILKIFVIYSLIGLLHWRFRRQFLAVSETYHAAAAAGTSVRWWDFLFYMTFGVVVTSSVKVAGVLLVFSFLVVPSVCGVLLAHTTVGRLMIGWLTALATSVAGIAVSYCADLPTGAAVVCCFGVCLVICLLFSRRDSGR